MDYNCAENFTSANSCQATLDELRDDSMLQVGELFQDSVLLSIVTGLYTLSAALFATSTYILWAKGILLKPNLAMWLATLVMFVGSTAHYTVVWLWMVHDKSVTQYFVDTSWDLFYANTVVSWPHGGPSLSAILQYLPIVNYLLSDVIVFWRAWILWNRSRWIAILAGTLITGTAVSAIVSAQATVGLDVDVLVSNFIRIHNDSTYNEMVIGQWVVWAMSLGSNILATVLIGYKACQYRASIKVHLKGANRWTKTEAILVFLIESAILYCGVWILYIASQVMIDQIELNQAMPLVLAQMAGLYPTAIIVLVALQKTTWDMTASTRMTPTRIMEFAMRGAPPNASAFSVDCGIGGTLLSMRPSAIEIGEQRLVVVGQNFETAEV